MEPCRFSVDGTTVWRRILLTNENLQQIRDLIVVDADRSLCSKVRRMGAIGPNGDVELFNEQNGLRFHSSPSPPSPG